MRAREFIVEALTPEQTAKLFKALGEKYDANIHDNVFKGKSRIYIPLEGSTGADIPQQSVTQSEVQKAVQSVGYKIDDYKAGIASKADDPNRKIKIGKLIKDQKLLQQFANDKSRAAAKQQNLAVAISRDPVDIGGMSTDRGWTSCMDLDGGVNRRYVPTEIKNGTIIAYLINDDDRDINRPKARILLKPYYYQNHMILVPDQVYGTAPNSFSTLVQQFASWANSGSPEGDYRLAKGSYADDRDTKQYHVMSYDNIETASFDKKLKVASSAGTPSQVLGKLAGDNSENIRRLVAENDSTPPEALAQLAQDRDGGVRSRVASNASTPPEALAQLAQDRDEQVRRSVALKDSTPPEALAQLARDRDRDVRRAVANNTSTPPEALAQLAQDRDEQVRWSVASNPSTSPEALAQLAQERIIGIRYAVAENTSTPPELLAQLARDQNADTRRKVAEHASTPPEALAQLAQDRNEYVRGTVAENTSTPPEALAQLAQDRNTRVRETVAENTSTPPEALAQLAQDRDELVRFSASLNPSTPSNAGA
jgi:hypothetical protein